MEKVTIDYKRLCLELEKQGKTKADLSRDMAKNKNFVGMMEKNPDQPAEVKADLHRNYGGLADKKPDGHAARQFIHKAYESYSVRGGEENE